MIKIRFLYFYSGFLRLEIILAPVYRLSIKFEMIDGKIQCAFMYLFVKLVHYFVRSINDRRHR